MFKHMHGFHQLRGPMAPPGTNPAKTLLMHAFTFTYRDQSLLSQTKLQAAHYTCAFTSVGSGP